MEITNAYKNTEAGVIPREWECVSLRDVCKFENGKAHENEIEANGKYIVVNSKFVSTEGKVKKYSNKGILIASVSDLLIVMSDVPNGRAIAKCFYVNEDNKYTVNQRIGKIMPTTISSKLLFYIVNRNPFYLSFDDGVKQTNLRKQDVVGLKIAIPSSTKEQQAIATALSDIDSLINSLTKLINKKKNIKQGAMQELLYSQENWVTIILGKSAVLKARIGWQGLTTAEYKESGEILLVTGTDFKNGFIDWEHCHYVDRERYVQDKNIQLKINDVLVTKDGTIGKVAFVNELPKQSTLNSGIFVIRPIAESFVPEFFYYILLSRSFNEFLDQLCAGSTISHLYQKDFVNFTFSAPKSLVEQKRIANLLSDMDIEIKLLEQKLGKYHNIKQGMMQELLTGKIRLLEEVAQ